MAKRELIDRNDLDITTIETDDFSGNEVLDVVLMEDVKEAHVITEQEIVKPYLDKLKEQIVGKSFTEEVFDEHAFDSMYSESISKDTAECESYIEMTIIKMDDVLRLIGNLLSESEGKK